MAGSDVLITVMYECFRRGKSTVIWMTAIAVIVYLSLNIIVNMHRKSRTWMNETTVTNWKETTSQKILNPANSSTTKATRSTEVSETACEDKRWGKDRENSSGNARPRYTAINPGSVDTRRLGNQLFNFASVLLVARLTGRKPLMPQGWLDDTFDLRDIDRIYRFSASFCPCFVLHERNSLQFDERLLTLTNVSANTILLNGYFQSWKYLQPIADDLRCHLKFRKDIIKAAEKYINEHIPSGWENGTYARVGVHVRRGDILMPHFQLHGYTVPTMEYFRSAIDYFRKLYSRIYLIVTTDDIRWTKSSFQAVETDQVKVIVSEGNSAPVDLAILALSDALIMSAGTYGWWAAWLANVTTIYYKDWPRNGSALYSHFTKEDFFPPDWIGM